MTFSRRRLGSVLLAAVVLFVWQTVANLLMPWSSGAAAPVTDEPTVLEAVLSTAPESGTYFVPYDEENTKAGEPEIFLALQRSGGRSLASSITGQILANGIALAIAALILARLGLRRTASRAALVGSLGVLGWIIGSVPHYLWWAFDLTFVAIELLNTAIGWTLAGVVLAVAIRPSGILDTSGGVHGA